MTLLGKLLGRDPEALRKDADAAYAAKDWGSAKLGFQKLLEVLKQAPEAERTAIRQRLDDCQTELVKLQLAEVDRLWDEGDRAEAVHLCRATIEMADGLPIKTQVKAKADALTEESVRAAEPAAGETTEEDVFLALSGAWSEDQADQLTALGDEFKQAFLGLHQGQAEAARDVFRRLLGEHPENQYLKLELARALIASRRREPAAAEPSEDEAKQEFLAALEVSVGLFQDYLENEPEEASDELFASVQSELGQALFELGRKEEAEKALVEAADATHEQTYGHLNLGRFYRLTGRFDEAIKRLEIAVEKMGTLTPDTRVYRELGLSHRDAGHRDEAIDCLKAVVDHQASLGDFDFDPETAEPLAELYVDAGDRDQASDLYRHLANGRNLAQHFRYHLLAGKLLKEAGRKGEGVRELRAARAVAPDDAARAEVDALLGGGAA